MVESNNAQNYKSFSKKKVKLNKNLKVFVGTAPLNIADKKNFIKKFSTPLESYGMTEILIFSSQKKEQKSKSLTLALF